MATAFDMDLLGGGEPYAGLLDDYLASSVSMAFGGLPPALAAAPPAPPAVSWAGLLPGVHAPVAGPLDAWAVPDGGEAVMNALALEKAAVASALRGPLGLGGGALGLGLPPAGLFTVAQLEYMIARLQQPRIARAVSAADLSSPTTSRPDSPRSPHSADEPTKPALAVAAVTRVASSASVASMAGARRSVPVVSSPKTAPAAAAPAPRPADVHAAAGPAQKQPKRPAAPAALPAAKRARRARRDSSASDAGSDADESRASARASERADSVSEAAARREEEEEAFEADEEEAYEDEDEEDDCDDEPAPRRRRRGGPAQQRRAPGPRPKHADPRAALLRRTVAEGPAPAACSPAGAASRHPNEKAVPLEDILPLLSRPLVEAARTLAICPTTLKKVCRKYGIARWPSRKLRALGSKGAADEHDRMVSTIQTTIRAANGRRGSEASSVGAPAPMERAARRTRAAASGAAAPAPARAEEDEEVSIDDAGSDFDGAL
eukprot:tig00001443_g8749.t1